ncbi:MAG: tRNA pseudouridine(55) synthase TruB, partial [Actinomycetota bacterium]
MSQPDDLGHPPSGLLVVDKPPGPTSHDVVEVCRGLFSVRKVGHAGTLDPPATGILLVGLGKATRLLPFLQSLAKSYRATVAFGLATTTQDATGEVVEERACEFGQEELSRAASRFVGEISQVPPMVSAVKIGGEPLYRAARRGEEVVRPARKLRIYELAIESFDAEGWTVTIFVRCSSGTYIRTLASDLGEDLGCGAHLRELRRLQVGSFGEAEAVSLDRLASLATEDRAGKVMPMRRAMRDFPSVTVEGEDLRAVLHGRPLTEAPAPARGGELTVLARPRAGDLAPHQAG